MRPGGRAARHEDVRAGRGCARPGGHARRDRVAQLGHAPHVRVAVDARQAARQLLGPATRGSGAPRVADVEREDLAAVRRHAAEKRRVRARAQGGGGGSRGGARGIAAILRAFGGPLQHPPALADLAYLGASARRASARGGRGAALHKPRGRSRREPRHPTRSPIRSTCRRSSKARRRGAVVRFEQTPLARARDSKPDAARARSPRRAHGRRAHAHAARRGRRRSGLPLRRRLRRRRALGAPSARSRPARSSRVSGASASSRRGASACSRAGSPRLARPLRLHARAPAPVRARFGLDFPQGTRFAPPSVPGR